MSEPINEKVIPVKTVYDNGCIEWHMGGKLHREDGPAAIYPELLFSVKEEWYLNDKLHRENGPAVLYYNRSDMIEDWYLNDALHRVDGPARIYKNGKTEWYLNGKRHREGGPAVESPNGTYEWYLNGKLHREGGPAKETFDSKSWYIDGVQYTESKYYEIIKPFTADELDAHHKMPELTETPKTPETPERLVVLGDYNKHIQKKNMNTGEVLSESFWLDKKLHRLNGPALVKDGSKYWYLNGELHRIDDPAIERADGTKRWYVNGKEHREDGPAVEFANGCYEWHLNGILHRIGGPAIHDSAYDYWYVDGKRHRLDGPAVIKADGSSKKWYIEGKEYTESEFNEIVKPKKYQVKLDGRVYKADEIEII
jgi:hypothetical protein